MATIFNYVGCLTINLQPKADTNNKIMAINIPKRPEVTKCFDNNTANINPTTTINPRT
jgi:hypothetical protein